MIPMAFHFPRRVLITLAVLLVAASSASAQTQLRWKLAPGQVFNHNLSQESTLSANVGGQTIDSKSTLTVENVWTVNKVDSEGIADVTQAISRVRMKMGAPTG